MKKIYAISLLAIGVLAGGAYATAEDASGGSNTPAVESSQAHASSDSQRAERAAALKAKINAYKEGRMHPTIKKVDKPIADQNVRGANKIQAKIADSKKAGERGNAKLKQYMNDLFGGLQGYSDAFSGSENKGSEDKEKTARKMSFKERLKLELAKQKKRTEAK